MIIKSGTKINLENVSEHQVISFIKDALLKYPDSKEMGVELNKAFEKLLIDKEDSITKLQEELLKRDKALEKWKFIKPILTSAQKDKLIDNF